ncbi:MAG: 2-phosphosulfolactate phosphatase [Chloroflexota bacterium]
MNDDLITVARVGLDGAAEATGTVIVIDVLRAFTTAAFAFAAGAEAIIVVSGVEEAFALRQENPDWLIMGEKGGLPVDGFDLDNSPAGFIGLDLTGCTLIQRTTSGTQGVVRSRRAHHLFASSLCCARATVRAVESIRPRRVTMVITGSHAGGLRDEDLACADYLEDLIRGRTPEDQSVVERVLTSRAARKFRDPAQPQFSPADLDCAVDIDRFAFAMQVRGQGGWRVMTPVSVHGRDGAAGPL